MDIVLSIAFCYAEKEEMQSAEGGYNSGIFAFCFFV